MKLGEEIFEDLYERSRSHDEVAKGEPAFADMEGTSRGCEKLSRVVEDGMNNR